jgi:hypothetical protein
MKGVHSALEIGKPSTPETDADPQKQTGPFDTFSGPMSELVKSRARQEAFNAWMTQKFVDWAGDRAKARPNYRGSPTPIKGVSPPTEWRKFYRARQARFIEELPVGIRPTQVLAHPYSSPMPEPEPLKRSGSNDFSQPKLFLAEPLLAFV